MTNETGLQNQSQQPSKAPWERVWNDLSAGLESLKEDIVTTMTEPWTPPPKAPPWERKWNDSQPPKEPRKVAPSKFDEVFSRLIGAESGGVHAKGDKLTTSNKGAQGITQVMPATGKDPGYGIKPLQNKTEGEYRRFGQDYLRAMLNEFGNDYEMALAAYNAGVGNVKEAVAKGGRDWKKHLPKPSETVPYIEKILKGK